jgi:hypothetical protein
MNKIEDYFASYEKDLLESFKRIRTVNSDSSVKGGANEKVISLFLKNHFPSNFNVTNVQVIDAKGNASDEIDVCVCNKYQPFQNNIGGLVIAEGVDFVVQVKAILTDSEIDRIIKNAKSLKNVIRTNSDGDQIYKGQDSVPHYIDRIPYFVIAFDSQLSFETVHDRIINKLSATDMTEQPDGIFILNKASYYNNRNFQKAGLITDGSPIKGWVGVETKDSTLLEFMRALNIIVPKIFRIINPLCHYFPQYIKDGKMVIENKK